jgi:LysR family transcriptional activator of glutamate synthase operon
MEIRQLELLLAVIDTGSVTRAAERVCLSPGAVSMQLHQLGVEVRAELFVRSGRKFMPTPAALRLAEHARNIVRQVRQIQQEFEADPAKDQRPFHFATGATALIYCLGRPLRAVRAQYRDAEIQVTVSTTEGIVAGLLERRFDLGLISLPYPDEGLKLLPLFEEELLILRPSRSPIRRGAIGTVQPSELSNAPFLLYPHSSNMRRIIDGFFAECRIQPRVVMEADDTEAIKGLVSSGFGYSILPEHALRVYPRHFQALRVADRRLTRTQALAMPRTDYPRALTAGIADLLRLSLEGSGLKMRSR